MTLRYLVCLLTVLICSATRPAANTHFQMGGSTVAVAACIEQQSVNGKLATYPNCVSNGTVGALNAPCVWSFDDSKSIGFGGYLDPGESYTFNDCVVSDGVAHIVRQTLYYPNGSVGIGSSITVDDGLGNKMYATNGTIAVVDHKNSSSLTALWSPITSSCGDTVPIANTGTQPNTYCPGLTGGYGHVITITHTIKNSGSRRVSNISWIVETTYQYVSNVSSFCLAGPPPGTFCYLGNYQPLFDEPWMCWCSCDSAVSINDGTPFSVQ